MTETTEQEMAWVRSLHDEIDSLYIEHRLALSKPAVVLHRGRAYWGSWDPLHHTISLSADLIEQCPWWIVLEILKHELAHLIADLSGSSSGDETAHGPLFQKICGALRVAPWARRAAMGHTLEELVRIADWRQKEPDEATRKYRRRLQKFLALANSTNEHEAMNAVSRAQELQARYRIDSFEQGRTDAFVNLEISSGKRRHAPYEGRIASILISHFSVQVVFCTRYNAMSNQVEAAIDVMGRPEDVLLAEYVHAFLHSSVQSLWHEKRKRGAKGLRARNSYIQGVLAGFHNKLDREQDADNQEQSQDLRALVRTEDTQREQFCRQRYPSLTSRGSSSRVDPRSFLDGKREGGKLHLRPPISETRQQRLLS